MSGTPATHPSAELDALAQAYGAALKRYFQRRLPPQAEVDDLVQDVFLRLVGRGDIHDIENMEGFLFQVASNILKDRQRQRFRRSTDFHLPLEENYVQDSAFSPERVLQGKESLDRLMSAVLELPERTRDVFMLCCFEGYTQEEAARSLDMSSRSIHNHLHKALAYLLARRRDDW